MTNRGVVFDLGYVPHEGPRLATGSVMWAIVREGVRRVFAIRRHFRKKILPWLLVIAAVLPAVVFVGLAFFLSTFAPEAETPFGSHADYFSLVGAIVLLFCGLAAPELLIPDREEGVLAVYASRPLRAWHYLVARAIALGFTVAGFLVFPNLLLYLGFAAQDRSGFAQGLIGNADDLVRILATSVVYFLGYGAPAFLVASFAKRTAPATGVYLAIMLITPGLAEGLAESGATGSRYAALLSIAEHPPALRDWIFDRFGGSTLDKAGFDPWVSLLVIGLLVAAAATLALRRYRGYL